MVDVVFIHADGSEQTYASSAGDTVMDVALDNGVAGITAQCGGGCTCCTCHCWVDPAGFEDFAPPHQDELDILEYAWGRQCNSRLSCQLALNGSQQRVVVRVPLKQS